MRSALVGKSYGEQVGMLSPRPALQMKDDKSASPGAPGADKKPDAGGAAPHPQQGPGGGAPAGGGTDVKPADPAKAQEDATKGAKDEAKKDAGTPGPESGPPAEQQGTTTTLSPVREALLQQFIALEGKGVGDAEFDKVVSASEWEKIKKKEAETQKQYDIEYAAACEEAKKNGTKPPPHKKVPVYTTCISTVGALTNAVARAQHLSSNIPSPVTLAYAKDKPEAFHESKMGTVATPAPGDILVLESQGAGIDALQKQIAFNDTLNFGPRERKAQKQIDDLNAAAASTDAAKAAAAQAKQAELVKALDALKAQHAKVIQDLKTKIDAKRQDVAATAAKKQLAFAHVAFFKDSKPEIGKDGQPTGRLLWSTFNGGATVQGKIGNQGAKSGVNAYDPSTNEIAQVEIAGVPPRWLAGWVDIEKLLGVSQANEDSQKAQEAKLPDNG